MRVLVLCLLAGAVASETLTLGYGLGNGDLRYSLDGGKSAFKDYQIKIEPWMLEVNDAEGPLIAMGLAVRAELDFLDCPNCANQRIEVFQGVGPSWNPNHDVTLNETYTLSGTKWAFKPVMRLIADTTYNIRVMLTCPNCNSAAELSRLDVMIMEDPTTSPKPWRYGGMNWIDDRNNDWYPIRTGSWSPVFRINGTRASVADRLFLLAEITSVIGFSKFGAVYYFADAGLGAPISWDNLLATNDNETRACAMVGDGCTDGVGVYFGDESTFPRLPVSQYSGGEFPVGKVNSPSLANAYTYVRAYGVMNSNKPGADDFDVRWAVGLNRVPASAVGSVPSLFVVTLLSFAAFWRN